MFKENNEPGNLHQRNKIIEEKAAEYIKGEIYFNPKAMSQLRIKQFTNVQTSSPYKGKSRNVNISKKLLSVLREQSKSTCDDNYASKFKNIHLINQYSSFSGDKR